MSPTAIFIRVLIGLAVTFHVTTIVFIAVFAVPGIYTGASAIVMSLLIVSVGGVLPIAFFMYLFRDRIYYSPARLPVVGARYDGGGVHVADAVVAPGPDLVEPLSERELQVLTLIARGRLNKEIAQELSVTIGTVKTHTNNINRKLGARSRTQAVAVARDRGLI